MKIHLKYSDFGETYSCKGELIKKESIFEGEGIDSGLGNVVLKAKFYDEKTKNKLLVFLNEDEGFIFIGNKNEEKKYPGKIYSPIKKINIEDKFEEIEETLKEESSEEAFLKIID
ncbi:MAG: hypothetical protein WC812_01495 [Candidatus Pacearchaeota archaeon]|jgi:hypothetical protein